MAAKAKNSWWYSSLKYISLHLSKAKNGPIEIRSHVTYEKVGNGRAAKIRVPSEILFASQLAFHGVIMNLEEIAPIRVWVAFWKTKGWAILSALVTPAGGLAGKMAFLFLWYCGRVTVSSIHSITMHLVGHFGLQWWICSSRHAWICWDGANKKEITGSAPSPLHLTLLGPCLTPLGPRHDYHHDCQCLHCSSAEWKILFWALIHVIVNKPIDMGTWCRHVDMDFRHSYFSFLCFLLLVLPVFRANYILSF